jgi:hypothetical protein
MTDSQKKTPEIKELRDAELDAVTGGASMSSMVSEVLKNFGNALNTAARGG